MVAILSLSIGLLSASIGLLRAAIGILSGLIGILSTIKDLYREHRESSAGRWTIGHYHSMMVL